MADIKFKHHSKNWWGYSHHYDEWFHGDLEYTDTMGSPAIRRTKKDGKSEWILVDPNNLEKCSDPSTE